MYQFYMHVTVRSFYEYYIRDDRELYLIYESVTSQRLSSVLPVKATFLLCLTTEALIKYHSKQSYHAWHFKMKIKCLFLMNEMSGFPLLE